MNILINNVKVTFDDNGVFSVEDLLSSIKEHFKDVEYLHNSYDNPDDFYTKSSIKPYLKSKKSPEAIWVHSKQKFELMSPDDMDDDELYLFKDDCYLGKKVITTDEYNSLTHTIKLKKIV